MRKKTNQKVTWVSLPKKQKSQDCKQIFVSSVIKAKSIWLKRTVKVHRRQWRFCLLCIPLLSQLHIILFGSPFPSHTHPIQVQRGGWLTGSWLKHIPCHLISCGSLSQTQKLLNTPTGVFGFELFLSGTFGEEQQPSAKAIQNLYAPRAAVLRGSAKE